MVTNLCLNRRMTRLKETQKRETREEKRKQKRLKGPSPHLHWTGLEKRGKNVHLELESSQRRKLEKSIKNITNYPINRYF